MWSQFNLAFDGDFVVANQFRVDEYHNFTKKLLLTTACTVLLSSAVSSFMQSIIATFAPLVPTWLFSLVEIIIASLGLWVINKNGSDKHA